MESHPHVIFEVLFLMFENASANVILQKFRKEERYKYLNIPEKMVPKTINDWVKREFMRGSILHNWLAHRLIRSNVRNEVTRLLQDGSRSAPSVGGDPKRVKDHPEEINNRSRFGDMEADTMIGAVHSGAVLVVSEWSFRYMVPVVTGPKIHSE